MQRSVYLQGELGNKFGNKFTVNTDNYQEIFKCISANRPEFVHYLWKCDEQDINFIVDTAEGSIDATDLLTPVVKGDITIAIAPAGSKSGFGKILAAIAIIAVIAVTGGFAGFTTGIVGAAGPTQIGWAVAAAGGLSTPGMIVGLLAANLALAGIQQMMAPDPAVDRDSPTNYLFSGGGNNAKEGEPIPILYGELRVPGRPISIEVKQGRSSTGEFTTNNIYIDSNGNMRTTAVAQVEN